MHQPKRDLAVQPPVKRGISIGEAAKGLGVPITTFRDWINRGVVPGVFLTPGGHRCVSRSGLYRFARDKGIRLKIKDLRGAPRIRARKLRISLQATDPAFDRPLGEGEGRLRDVSLTGFRVDRLEWKGFIPVSGGSFGFSIDKGHPAGVHGRAELVWSMNNRKGRGITLGAHIERFGKETQAIWERYLSEAKGLKADEADD